MVSAVLLDIDGTLVDSNDAHARAWVRAFAEHGVEVSFASVRRAIGMGGDQLMPHVSHLREDSAEGKRIAERRGEIFRHEYVPRLRALPCAGELVAALRARFKVVVASSAKKQELELLLAIASAQSLLDTATSSDDADASKPAPDIVEAALRRAAVEAQHAVLIGDTPYDIAAARRAGVGVIAFRSGGWRDDDLRGAVAIYDGPWHLLETLDESALFNAADAQAAIPPTENAAKHA
jgi:HAD superfamily hydrolase (TIGR01509 family)